MLRPVAAKIRTGQTSHKQINVLAWGLVSHTQLALFLQHNNYIPEIFLVFTVFPV